MCLPVSRLFWVSSLAYPNLLGTKGYVVVVVVVSSIAVLGLAIQGLQVYYIVNSILMLDGCFLKEDK